MQNPDKGGPWILPHIMFYCPPCFLQSRFSGSLISQFYNCPRSLCIPCLIQDSRTNCMLSSSSLPFWATTPFLQTSADTSFYEEGSTDCHPHPYFHAQQSLLGFFLLLQVRQLVILYLCNYLRTISFHLPLLSCKLQDCLFCTLV